MKHDKRAARFGAAYYGSEDTAFVARMAAERRVSVLALQALARVIGVRSRHIAEQGEVLARLTRGIS